MRYERLFVALEAVLLALWAGAMAGFAFIFAPVASRHIGNMETFAAMIAAVIRALTAFGNVCGALAVALSLARAFSPRARTLACVRIGLVAVGLAASAYETSAIMPRMEATAAQIPGPIDSVPKTDARRIAYDREHTNSTRVYGLAFLCVLAAVALVPFGRRSE